MVLSKPDGHAGPFMGFALGQSLSLFSSGVSPEAEGHSTVRSRWDTWPHGFTTNSDSLKKKHEKTERRKKYDAMPPAENWKRIKISHTLRTPHPTFEDIAKLIKLVICGNNTIVQSETSLQYKAETIQKTRPTSR